MCKAEAANYRNPNPWPHRSAWLRSVSPRPSAVEWSRRVSPHDPQAHRLRLSLVAPSEALQPVPLTPETHMTPEEVNSWAGE